MFEKFLSWKRDENPNSQPWTRKKERERHTRARLGKRRKEKREKEGGRERERGRGREKSGRHARAREGGPNNISKLMSCGAFQRGPVDSAPPFCIR